jgi:glycogen debranching enzyme
VRDLTRLGTRGPLDGSAGPDSLFCRLFGRDSLLMALDLLDDFPAVSASTLTVLTALQGVCSCTRSEEEPGRILHERRCDPSHPTPGWDYPYYGTIDATALYVKLIGDHVRRHGPEILDRPVRDRAGAWIDVRAGLERALAWLEGRLSRFGYLYMVRTSPSSLANQVWPDSYDAFYFEDGSLFDLDLPRAPVCVQGYAYDALLDGAELTRDPARAQRLLAAATRLRGEVLGRFWRPEPGMFSLALVHGPAGVRASLVVASDAGHLLASRLLDGPDAAPHREALRARLVSPGLLAAAGLRLRAADSPRFDPGSYHNGSVWPMDTGAVAEGLRRHGYDAEADDLEDRLLRACAKVGFMAEFFRGDPGAEVRVNERTVKGRADGERRTAEQPPQRTQGWTTTRVWKILRRRGQIPYPAAPPPPRGRGGTSP